MVEVSSKTEVNEAFWEVIDGFVEIVPKSEMGEARGEMVHWVIEHSRE